MREMLSRIPPNASHVVSKMDFFNLLSSILGTRYPRASKASIQSLGVGRCFDQSQQQQYIKDINDPSSTSGRYSGLWPVCASSSWFLSINKIVFSFGATAFPKSSAVRTWSAEWGSTTVKRNELELERERRLCVLFGLTLGLDERLR